MRLAENGINVGGQSGVARIERGERPTRFNEVVSIAEYLNIDLNLALNAHGIATMRSEVEELDAAVAGVTAELHEVEEAMRDTAERRTRARRNLEHVETEFAEMEQRRRELARARAQLLVHLEGAADQRRRIEILRERHGK